MFRTEGSDQTDRENRILAGYLATIGGYVKLCGLRASEQWAAAGAALLMVVAFLGGAFVASMLVESLFFRRLGYA